MADDDVPPDEMFSIRRGSDDLDAARRGEPIDDRALADLVGAMRSAYLPEEPRRRSAALAAFAGPGDRPLEPLIAPVPAPAPVRRRAAAGFVAVLATLTGKLVLGGAVAAAAVGGLHAAEVVDVPLLPDVRHPAPATPAEPDPAIDGTDPVGEPPDVAEDTPPAGSDREPVGTSVPAPDGKPAPDGAPDAPSGPRVEDPPPGPPSTDAPPTTSTPAATAPATSTAPRSAGPSSTGDPEGDVPRIGGGYAKESTDHGEASPASGPGDSPQEKAPST